MRAFLLSFVISIFTPLVIAKQGINPTSVVNQNWHTYQSQNFQVFSTLKPKQIKAFTIELEDYMHLVSLLSGYDPVQFESRVPVVLLDDANEMQAMGIPSSIGGFEFSAANHKFVIAQVRKLDVSKPHGSKDRRQYAYHEVAHLVQRYAQDAIAMPKWYKEGLAEYFSSYQRKGDAAFFGSVDRIADRFYSMRKRTSGKFVSVDSKELFNESWASLIRGEGSYYNRMRANNQLYARAFSIVHYLQSNAELRQKAYEFNVLLGRGYTPDQVFKHVFKMPYTDFDKLVDDHINKPVIYGREIALGRKGVKLPKIKVKASKLDTVTRDRMILSYAYLAGFYFLSSEEYQDSIARLQAELPELAEGIKIITKEG